MTTRSSPSHLDDSALLHLVDRDASAWELDHWTRHVLGCGECTDRFRTLQRRAGRIAELLREVELPSGFVYPGLPAETAARSGQRRQPSPWLRAAAVLVILLAPLVLVQPARAWLGQWVSAGWEQMAAVFGGEPAAAPVPSAAESGSTLWFSASGEELVVELASAQAAGRLVLIPTSDARGSLEIVGGGAGETPLVTETELRIVNEPASVASYRITVPAGVERVVIRIGGAPPLAREVRNIGDEAGIDLGSAAAH